MHKYRHIYIYPSLVAFPRSPKWRKKLVLLFPLLDTIFDSTALCWPWPLFSFLILHRQQESLDGGSACRILDIYHRQNLSLVQVQILRLVEIRLIASRKKHEYRNITCPLYSLCEKFIMACLSTRISLKITTPIWTLRQTLSIYLSIYLSMALQSFCWTLPNFSVS
jgi:hypothetical protein